MSKPIYLPRFVTLPLFQCAEISVIISFSLSLSQHLRVRLERLVLPVANIPSARAPSVKVDKVTV